MAGAKPYRFSYHGGEQGKNNCISTPVKFIYPNAFAKVGVVPGGPKKNMRAEQTKGAPK